MGELDGLGHIVVGTGKLPPHTDIGVISSFPGTLILGGFGQTCVRQCVVATLLGVMSGCDSGDGAAITQGTLSTLWRTPGSVSFCDLESWGPAAATASEGGLAAQAAQDEEALVGASLVNIPTRQESEESDVADGGLTS